MTEHETVLKVSSSSSTQSVAAAISSCLEGNESVRLRAVGAGAVNQAVKALAVSRGLVASRGSDLHFKVGFASISGSTEENITAMEFTAFKS